MEYSKSVCISGQLLAAILFEQTGSLADQEGFLLGESVIREVESISDNQISVKKEEMIINIFSYIPCDYSACSFYFADGRINNDMLRKYLDGKMQDVIGWYHFRRHVRHRMSLREKAVHKNLNLVLPQHSNMVFGLFSSAYADDDYSIYSCEHTFFFYNGSHFIVSERVFDPISLNIANLGDTNHESEYRVRPHAPVNTRSGAYGAIVTPNQDHEHLLKAVLPVEDINTSLLTNIENLVHKVADSEDELKFKIMDIAEIKKKIHELRLKLPKSSQ